MRLFTRFDIPLYTGELCYMLDESICHLRSVALILILMEILLTNNVDPDQTPHYVASDLYLHCLPMTLFGVPGKNRLFYTCNNLIVLSKQIQK